VETLQAFGALCQIPQYYRKFLYFKTKMLCNYLNNYQAKISDNNAESGKVPRMLAAFPR
jgi:hypothetical protein